jgi:hypothetical protein
MKTMRFAATFAIALFVAAGQLFAAAVNTKIDIPNVRCIKTSTFGEGKTDEVYLVVTGIAKGEAVARRFPEGKTLTASPKQQAVEEKAPVSLYEGKLDEGEFVALTVALLAGKGDAGHVKAYLDAKASLDKSVADLQKKTLTVKEVDEVRKAWNKANATFMKDIAKVIPADKGETLIGSFDLIVVNEGGKLNKRLTPAGLLTGEHYGWGVKRYSKIKYTLENVLVKDSTGQWYEMQMPPTSEDELIVRVKMLEARGERNTPQRHVTDYLVDLRVFEEGKAAKWRLAGDNPGQSIVHDYWDWAK